MAAILSPGEPSTATYFAADGPGGPTYFGGTICGMTEQRKSCRGALIKHISERY